MNSDPTELMRSRVAERAAMLATWDGRVSHAIEELAAARSERDIVKDELARAERALAALTTTRTRKRKEPTLLPDVGESRRVAQ